MTNSELKAAVMKALEDYFSDASVEQSETKDGLEGFILEIQGMIESMDN